MKISKTQTYKTSIFSEKDLDLDKSKPTIQEEKRSGSKKPKSFFSVELEQPGSKIKMEKRTAKKFRGEIKFWTWVIDENLKTVNLDLNRSNDGNSLCCGSVDLQSLITNTRLNAARMGK